MKLNHINRRAFTLLFIALTALALSSFATDFARPAELSPCPTHGHHWFANAESYFLIGDALGKGMMTLLPK